MQVIEYYELFGEVIASEIAIPELSKASVAKPRIQVSASAPSIEDVTGFTPCHDWLDSASRLYARTWQRGRDYRLSFPGRVDFLLRSDGVIAWSSDPTTDPATVRQLLLNQVIPRYLASAGHHILHASLVRLADERAIAFVGSSGRGKSTLAGYCARRGARIITDDSLSLRTGLNTATAYGGPAGLRLYPDSLLALGYDPQGFAPYQAGSEKRQLQCSPRKSVAARPLDALFLLGSLESAAVANSISVERARGHQAVMDIAASLFGLAPADPRFMQSGLRFAGQLVNQGPPVFWLNYPRQHDWLPALYNVLEELLETPANAD
ncbi:MAG: hypothetical protein AAGA91_09720 [Pseudomonadota bacterium]